MGVRMYDQQGGIHVPFPLRCLQRITMLEHEFRDVLVNSGPKVLAFRDFADSRTGFSFLRCGF
jgi:hypothetical protein